MIPDRFSSKKKLGSAMLFDDFIVLLSDIIIW